MKKTILIVTAALIGVNLNALADAEQAKKLTPLQKVQIAWAIRILGETKTLTVNQNQCVQFDQDILSVLEAEGHIQPGGAQPTAICVGGSGF